MSAICLMNTGCLQHTCSMTFLTTNDVMLRCLAQKATTNLRECMVFTKGYYAKKGSLDPRSHHVYHAQAVVTDS
jgi:hypothetical protein